jgi:peptidoglycan hydrolase CwlO-like protein
MKKIALTVSLLSVAIATGCASPTVVQTKQASDSNMTCEQLRSAYAEAQDFEAKARKERGVTGTNVAAAIFFWPAMIGTYKNTEEAIEAAQGRQKHLEKVGAEKNCKVV